MKAKRTPHSRRESTLRRKHMRKVCNDAISKIEALGLRRRSIESVIGVSPGYIRDLRDGKRKLEKLPITLLCLIAEDPIRLRELKYIWQAGKTLDELREGIARGEHLNEDVD